MGCVHNVASQAGMQRRQVLAVQLITHQRVEGPDAGCNSPSSCCDDQKRGFEECVPPCIALIFHFYFILYSFSESGL